LRLKKITTRLIRDFFILFEIFKREEGFAPETPFFIHTQRSVLTHAMELGREKHTLTFRAQDLALDHAVPLCFTSFSSTNYYTHDIV
jgi:hypothetical protein